MPAPLEPEPHVNRRLISDSAPVLAAFTEFLESNGIKPAPESPLEFAHRTLLSLPERLAPERLATESYAAIDALNREVMRGLGLLSFIARLMPALSTPFVGVALPHLRLLAKAHASGAQNVRASPLDQATQKLFELVAGAAVARFATNVTLDAPDSGKASKNPDVLCTFDGARWGIACKTINGTAHRTFAERVRDGVVQVVRSEAERGIVFVNLSNVLPYERIASHVDAAGEWVRVLFPSPKEALAVTRAFNTERLTGGVPAMDADEWRAALCVEQDGELVSRGVVALVVYTEISVTVMAPDGRPAWQQVIDIGSMPLVSAELDEAAASFIAAIRTAMRTSD